MSSQIYKTQHQNAEIEKVDRASAETATTLLLNYKKQTKNDVRLVLLHCYRSGGSFYTSVF